MIREAIEIAKKFAMINTDVLLVGESGTGKELFAHSIHGYGRPDKSKEVVVLHKELHPSWLQAGDEPWMMHHALEGLDVPIVISPDAIVRGTLAKYGIAAPSWTGRTRRFAR